jgi:hypothetical protein
MSFSWENLKSIAAVWGAGLSTATAVSLFLSTRPIFNPEPCEKGDAEKLYGNNSETKLNVRISNPSKNSVIQIVAVKVWGFGRESIRLASLESKNTRDTIVDVLRWERSRESGQYLLYMKPNDEVVLQIEGIRTRTKALIIFLWHRHGLIPRMPSFFAVNWGKAEAVNKGRLHA